jgi:DNA-binding CsgD family transcriptional regulator
MVRQKTSASRSGSIAMRWKRLPAEARALLTAFAVHPADLRADWLPILAQQPRAVDTLIGGGWIQESREGTWSLTDQSFRSPISKLATWSLRQSQHQTLAKLCHRGGTDFALAAYHFGAVGDTISALESWTQAVTSYRAVGDPVRILECLDAAHRVLTREDVVDRWDEFALLLEGCCSEPSIVEAVSSRIEHWLKREEQARNEPAIGSLGPILAGLLAKQGHHVRGAEWRVRAAIALKSDGQGARAARQLSAAALTYAYALQYSAARATALDAIPLALQSGDPAIQVEVLSCAGLLLGMKGETIKGREHLEHALDLALKNHLTSAAAEAYRMLGTVAEYASCYGAEQTAFSKALAYCRRHDASTTEDLCLGCLSYSLFRSGNWARSRDIVAEVLSRDRAPYVSRFVAEGVLGLLLAHRGELRQAQPLLEATIQGARETGIFAMELFGLWGLALVEEQSGQHAATALHYRALLAFWRGTDDRHDAIPGLSGGGLFFASQGDLETAAAFGRALDQISRETANPEAVGAAALVAGEGLRCGGKSEAAAKLFERALAAFEKRELVVERIQVLRRLAIVLRELGNDSQAARAAAEATKRARRLGARALLAPLDAVAGARTEQGDLWDGLSPRQRDVARHLTTGKTNKEIAARLGVSVRTVDMHVAHVLQRLGCRTRSEAAGRIALALR